MYYKYFIIYLFFLNHTCNSIYDQCPNPTHVLTALKDFERNHDLHRLKKSKLAVTVFYNSRSYDNWVRSACTQAQEHFARVQITPHTAIIFDIDDTAIFTYHLHREFDFIVSLHPELSRARDINFRPPIKPVFDLYQWLTRQGFKIFFLSARKESSYHYTHQELLNAGYTTFEAIILMPDKLFEEDDKTDTLYDTIAHWKLHVRQELEKKYTLCGCIGDRDVDFFGGHTGYSVKLPNFLY